MDRRQPQGDVRRKKAAQNQYSPLERVLIYQKKTFFNPLTAD